MIEWESSCSCSHGSNVNLRFSIISRIPHLQMDKIFDDFRFVSRIYAACVHEIRLEDYGEVTCIRRRPSATDLLKRYSQCRPIHSRCSANHLCGTTTCIDFVVWTGKLHSKTNITCWKAICTFPTIIFYKTKSQVARPLPLPRFALNFPRSFPERIQPDGAIGTKHRKRLESLIAFPANNTSFSCMDNMKIDLIGMT